MCWKAEIPPRRVCWFSSSIQTSAKTTNNKIQQNPTKPTTPKNRTRNAPEDIKALEMRLLRKYSLWEKYTGNFTGKSTNVTVLIIKKHVMETL